MNTKRTHPTLEDLSPEQRAWLLGFKEANGRTWKDKLMTHWMNGTDDSLNESWFARQIRNNFGPTWLTKMKD